MKNKWRKAMVLVLTFCLSMTCSYAQKNEAIIQVSVMPMIQKAETIKSKLRGSVVAKNEIPIRSALQQLIVTQILVDIGSHVKKGDVLATLETPEQDGSVKQVQAELEKSQALIKQQEALSYQADMELKRIKSLANKGVISGSDADKYQAEASAAFESLNAARAEYRQLSAVLKIKQQQQAKTIITAPIAGVISERYIKAGTLTDESPLFKLIENNQLEFEVKDYQTQLENINKNQTTTIFLNSGKKLKGYVRYQSPKIDPLTQLGTLRITFDADNLFIRDGEYGYALFESNKKYRNMLPYSAVSFSPENTMYVFVIGENNRVSKKNVTTGVIVNNQIEILSGLLPDDKVVISASSFLNENDSVSMTYRGK